MSKKKTVTDILYNGLYQVVILVIPFLTQPYLYRVMNARTMGLNALINSIPSLLTVVILFGMNQFGVRIIAQSERDERLASFAKLWLIQLIVGTVVIIGYVLWVVFVAKYKLYYFLEVPFLLGYVIDISWLYVGSGKIRDVVIRNTLIKLLIVCSVFLFVHSVGDLWKFLLINSVTYLANVIFWVSLPKLLGRFPHLTDFTWSPQYFQSALTVLLPTLAAQLYVTLDQTLVGSLAGPLQLSYYAYPQSLCRAVIAITGSVSTVLMPAMVTAGNHSDNSNRVIRIFKASLDYTLVVSVYLAVAFMVNAAKFTTWFWNAKGPTMGENMALGSLIIIFVSYGGVFANQYTLAQGLYRKYSIPYYIGAVVSLSLNPLAILHFGSLGATIVIVCTEFIVMTLRVFLLRNRVPVRQLFRGNWTTLVSGALALIVAYIIKIHFSSMFLDLVIQTVVLTVVYICGLVVFHNRVWEDCYRRIRTN